MKSLNEILSVKIPDSLKVGIKRKQATSDLQYHESIEEVISSYDNVISELDKSTKDKKLIQEFYNGKDLICEEEAKERGIRNTTNNLSGYDRIKNIQSQIYSHYSQGPNLFRIELTQGTFEERTIISQDLTEVVNHVIRESGRFAPEWLSASGELSLHGMATFVFEDKDWCPKLRDVKIPAGTGILPSDMHYAFSPADISLGSLMRVANRKKSKKWKVEEVKHAIKAIKENFLGSGSSTEREEGEDRLDVSNITEGKVVNSIPVFYYYEVDHTQIHKPVSVYIIARYNTYTSDDKGNKSTESHTKVLYSSKDEFPYVKAFYCPIYVDTKIGGRQTVDEVMGTGALNYNSDVAREEAMNEAFESALDSNKVYWSVENSALQRFNQYQSSHSNIIPQGATPVETQSGRNLQSLFAVMDMHNRTADGNAGSISSNSGSSERPLEVEVMAASSRQASAYQARNNDITNRLTALYTEMTSKILTTNYTKQDDGYAEHDLVMDMLKERGYSDVEIGKLMTKKHERFLKIKVIPEKILGGGNSLHAVAISNYLMGTLQFRNEESRKKIMLMSDKIMINDSDIAADLNPLEDERNIEQETIAREEYAAMRRNGILGQPLPINPSDNDTIHIQQGMFELQSLIAIGQIQGWSEMEQAAFDVCSQHIGAHIERMSTADESGEQTKLFSDALSQLTSQAGEFVNNLEKKREAESQPIDQLKQADLQLKARQQEALEFERDRKFDLAAQKAAVDANSKAANAATFKQKVDSDTSVAQAKINNDNNE